MTVAPLTKHPAKFSDPILAELHRLVRAEQRRRGGRIWVVDPYAGVGRIHRLASKNIITTGIEIEAPWAACHSDTVCADSYKWLPQLGLRGNVIATGRVPGVPAWVAEAAGMHRVLVDVFATSPDYGNRLADHHDARDGSERRSYRHDLGRMPTEGSTAVLHWGPEYWQRRALGYRLMFAALRPGGLLVLNVKDIRRGGQMIPATMWHHGACIGAGFEPVPRGTVRVPVKSLRYGANHGHHAAPGEETRADHEIIYQFRKPGAEL